MKVEAKSEVENGIRSIFKIRPNAKIRIQRLDPDWQEYVDIEDTEADLGNREKLKVLLLATSNATSPVTGSCCYFDFDVSSRPLAS